MTVSVMLTFWEGGGAPKDAQTMTYAGSPEFVREQAIGWLDAHLGFVIHPDAPDVTVRDGAVHITDVPLVLWPMLEDFEEDLTDAAA
jgi:hypothetical protein